MAASDAWFASNQWKADTRLASFRRCERRVSNSEAPAEERIHLRGCVNCATELSKDVYDDGGGGRRRR